MDYGNLLNRAWTIIWKYKFLIVLGILVALSSGIGSGASSSVSFTFTRDLQSGGEARSALEALQDPWDPASMPVRMVMGLALAGLVLALALIVWAVSTISRGGLIAGVESAETRGVPNFGLAWDAGFRRVWTLLGIAIVPAIPGLLVLLAGLGSFFFTADLFGQAGAPRTNALALVLVFLACIAVPLSLVLELLRTLANRACMLEGRGVIDAYGRGFRVLAANFGSALVLFLLQVVISIGVAILLIVPVALTVLCCVLWPLLIFAQGVVAAYFSTMWTLAWREWTVLSEPQLEEAS
jgi:hypothetical protein